MSQFEEVSNLCEKVCEKLRTNRKRLVLAESCTAGLIAAELGHLPGVSEVLCGSFVAYQVESKVEWLGVPRSLIDRHNVVSQRVAEEMAMCALRVTPHAHVGMSVTGHVGPNAPAGLDGLVWCAVADQQGVESKQFQMQLEYGANASVSDPEYKQAVRDIRVARQYEVVQNCLGFLLSRLEATAGTGQN